ncbi:MAG: hypothetical protein GTN97_01960 [Nitrosopumilaceae archaeon]|nr:hypothetical protein [Nitrosopumilaceae archaeon]NIP09916.1 hypothetical protein [Nitrosopumilaceae archaeon]NIS94687.1 hypothetical protein [Nitrosopumilaceae archaeon]
MNKKLFFGILVASVFAISISMTAHVSANGGLLPTPEITNAGTIEKATLYDNGDDETWEVEAIAEGDLGDFSRETGNEEKGLGSVVGVFNEDIHTIWITGQHKVDGLDNHDGVDNYDAHSHTVVLKHSDDCASGFAYDIVSPANETDTTIVYDPKKDKTTIRHFDIPSVQELADINQVCGKGTNGNDVGAFYVWEFYRGDKKELCVDFDTARSHDQLISQNKNGGFECP